MTFPIVGIAASAGGLEAVSELISALPAGKSFAYVYVQHLDPDHESLLPEILSKRTPLPVATALDGLAIAPGHLYVIPPNVTPTVVDHQFKLFPRDRSERHMPADAFFKSLAHSLGENSIGVVLSGGDSDGALGIQAIKRSGGITFAQEPATARFPSMPQNAIATGCVDFVLGPEEIALELARLEEHPYLRPAAPPPAAEASHIETSDTESHVKRIFRRLRTAHSVDFMHYKRSTLMRRLARRMALRKIDDIAEYAELVEDDPAELASLHQDFLIRVTEFFRDPESFEALRQHVFQHFPNHSAKAPIRIWVPGCSTGEEVYSLAIALVEFLGDGLTPSGLQLFGTDVSETAVEQARSGLYLDTIVQEVSSERIKRFFVKQDNRYRIAKSIRDLCIFAQHDVTRDPAFSRLDLISCRNLLIYLDAVTQRRVIQMFHYALKSSGVLMLGPSESVGHATDLFELTDKQHTLYWRKGVASGSGLELGAGPAAPYGRSVAAVGAAALSEVDSAHREADRLLLSRFAPASLLVDGAGNILQFRGETAPYVEHASGPSSLNLHRVARTELLADISAAMQDARETGAETRRDGLSIDERRDVSIVVIPLQRMSPEPCYLILFEDGSRPPGVRRIAQPAATPLTESEKDRRLAQAEREVAAMRDYLRATMEEQEAVQEELKSAHEEALSANEEFQSTNEELETAKEELQSANEELTTTNDELRDRNHALAKLNVEVENTRAAAERDRASANAIIETVKQPLLVLQNDLTIIRANHAFFADFKVRSEQTVGRRLYEIGDGQWSDPILRSKLEAVIATDGPSIEIEVDYLFPLIGHRVMHLTARKIPADDERADLLLLAIEDITEQQASTKTLRDRSQRKDAFLAMLAHELRNPLTPITHAIHLLRAKDVDAASVKLYDMIARQTNQLVHLVDELLDVARIGRGTIELNRERVDLAALVRAAVDANRFRVDQRQQQLLLSIPDAPLYVDGDVVRLQQVVANLLENASKYTPPGGTIALTLDRQHGATALSVRDTGIGIARDMLEEIFELFTQVDASLARSGGGLGLGLTVVRQILELHGGGIEARSAGLGQGSEFIARLPLPSTASDEAPIGTIEPTETPANGHGRRVLIVDDNDDLTESLSMLARDWGHEVATARDGQSALNLVATFQPESVLIDIGLPGMDGYELARRLRQSNWHGDLHLVAVTGYGRVEDRERARAAGFDLHLTKPVALDDLRRLLADGEGPEN